MVLLFLLLRPNSALPVSLVGKLSLSTWGSGVSSEVGPAAERP